MQGSGAIDKNETLGFIHKNGPKPPALLWDIASISIRKRLYRVLRYDKRGVSGNYTILDSNVWGNNTANDQIQDGKKALNVLVTACKVDPKKISIIGHSEGTLYAPRVAMDNSTNVKNIVTYVHISSEPFSLEYNLDVSLPSKYATQVLDKNHTGLISIQQIAKDPLLSHLLVSGSVLRTNNIKDITNTLLKAFGTSSGGAISIDKQLKPALKGYMKHHSFQFA